MIPINVQDIALKVVVTGKPAVLAGVYPKEQNSRVSSQDFINIQNMCSAWSVLEVDVLNALAALNNDGAELPTGEVRADRVYESGSVPWIHYQDMWLIKDVLGIPTGAY